MMDDGKQPHQSTEACVSTYLERMLQASKELLRAANDDDNMEVEQESCTRMTPDGYIDAIAVNLVQACTPKTLSLGVSHLPTLNIFNYDESTDLLLAAQENAEEQDQFVEEINRDRFYQHRRTDYLRRLLRLMAPVAMEVCSTSLSIVLSKTSLQSSDDDDSTRQLQLAAVILLSHWLPVSPHLSTMATEFISCLDDPLKLHFNTTTVSDTSSNSMDNFIVVEALFELCSFYRKRREIATLRRLSWDWTVVVEMLHQQEDATMEDVSNETFGRDSERINHRFPEAIRWYAVRVLLLIMNWTSSVGRAVLEKWNLESDNVPWRMHSWELDQEELNMEQAFVQRTVTLWDTSIEFALPTSDDIQSSTKPAHYLARIGEGISFFKSDSFRKIIRRMAVNKDDTEIDDEEMVQAMPASRRLVPTATTRKNLSLLGAALCQEPQAPPILICGPHGAGKSSLVRELLKQCRPTESLIEFHIDEETDSKTLIGSYTTTDIPGEFAWRAGAFTRASREGRWILIEELDAVPVEIQAALVKVFEERMLPMGNGKYERCHPDFRIFATCTTAGRAVVQPLGGTRGASQRIGNHKGGGKHILNPSYWRNVHVKPLPFSELSEVAANIFPSVPRSIIDSALAVLRALDGSGRSESSVDASGDEEAPNDDNDTSLNVARLNQRWTGGRVPSVRDLFKLLSRIAHGICFEKNATFTTEAQRTICMAESVDIFVGSCTERDVKNDFVASIAAPTWGISRELAVKYVISRNPAVVTGSSFFEIGRARIDASKSLGFSSESSGVFAQTTHALRFMESLAVCVRENEPALLVGETGCGKTTMIQQLAFQSEKNLVVQNLSLQTDSTDLLGGYRPLEVQNVARHVYTDFVDVFVSSFSRKQNAKFLQYAASMLEKSNWKKLSQCFQKAAQLGSDKMRKLVDNGGIDHSDPLLTAWERFSSKAETFERQRISCDAGLAFEFAEGALVDAIQSGKWVLLDEINLASSDTLQRLCGLLDDPTGSVTLLERGDSSPVRRHPDFRLFAAMNPATDAGKKDLPPSIRSRFSELFVQELLDPIELRVVAARYLDGVLPLEGKSPEHTDVIVATVDVYMKCRTLAETTLADGNGHKPRYTMRSLSRALVAAKTLVTQQRIPLRRSVFEGFQLAFEGILDPSSVKIMKKTLKKGLLDQGTKSAELDHPGRRPGGKSGSDVYVLVKPFWIKAGPQKRCDWSEVGENGKSKFILTASVQSNLRRLSCSLAAGPWPILLEGPTSSGKTTLVEYIAARCGHHVVRINNHEHTDVQEYTGSFSTDQNGSLSFQDGILVQALRRGHWVILDELNLAPSEVLEALNRLLDDNRELYLAETNEIVKPHPNFRLFATQNPSGAYGGRKPLSKAFRNRFVELHVDDIPCDEMVTILEKRCGCPPSHAKQLVKIMADLRLQRSKSNVFLGKDSFITPRDLLRWAERHSGTKQDLAEHGFMLLAERLRTAEEKDMVRAVLEENLKATLDIEDLYFGKTSEARRVLNEAIAKAREQNNHLVASIAPTRSLLRLVYLVLNCVRKKEPVLLVGETGCGKTTVIQLLSFVLEQTLHSINCHATTETSDLIGGLRPNRSRDSLKKEIFSKVHQLVQLLPSEEVAQYPELDIFVTPMNDVNAVLQLDVDSLSSLVEKITHDVLDALPKKDGEHSKKRRKIEEQSSPQNSPGAVLVEHQEELERMKGEINKLVLQFKALFEWSDGPLVKAMRSGHLVLLDEMSLAEDAVLERLNSVLEPSRLLVLAEKGDSGSLDPTKDDRVIYAHEDFRIFATMNPGGDYGKRELSPALRSRFTEIWVPSISGREDFEIVLSQSLSFGLNTMDLSAITGPMLDYLEWFNSSVCGDLSSPFSGLDLSMRDILSWSHFIAASQTSESLVDIWDAFYHGACLMHLDGLGLGSGLSPEASQDLKKQAKARLQAFAPGRAVSNLDGVDQPFHLQDRKFGTFPYFIEIGESMIPESTFDMRAPTTSLNVFRVLRAMQVRKPILLEGPPGVGKTSLISALAAASGHKLVRINLSEQTDMGDLMGNDLPMESATSSGPSFAWCDGVLLTAIKEGSWVLLDELNLASQAVLEGLNSILDHRGTVYVPEIGKSFECPASFRVFGAQNPLGQGGGRKGLPKSFLNRFTKVFVDALTDSDFHSIIAARFKTLPADFVQKVVNFNNQIHREVVDLRAYGLEGSPWEFNLRDIFRWSELLERDMSLAANSARDLFYQRFRTPQDRKRVDHTFQEHFGSSMVPPSAPLLTIFKSTVQIGNTLLERCSDAQVYHGACSPRNSEVLLSNLLPMEAVARCVSLGWPCLLVGGTGSGKTSIISNLADMCNATLVQQCLSPSSDVSELLGAFEQAGSNEKELEIQKAVIDLAQRMLLSGAFVCSSSKKCLRLITEIENKMHGSTSNERHLATSAANALCKLTASLWETLNEMTNEDPSLSSFRDQLASIRSELSLTSACPPEEKSGHFVWRDGLLVEAMVNGYWLVLENVNLCPAAVLDRLNSVTESGGSLLLSESGTLDDKENTASHRLITPHRNFRIFLTMDPLNGEISRAMRNRCVEISLLESKATGNSSAKDLTVDVLGQLQSSGVRSVDLATKLVGVHMDERAAAFHNLQDPPFPQSISESGQILYSMLSRGMEWTSSFQKVCQLSYETEGVADIDSNEGITTNAFTPIPAISFPDQNSSTSICQERRLLRSFSSTQEEATVTIDLFKHLGLLDISNQGPQGYNIITSLEEVPLKKNLALVASKLFLGQQIPERIRKKALSLQGLRCKTAAETQGMASLWLKECQKKDPAFLKLVWNRLENLFQEEDWTYKCLRSGDTVESLSGLMVLEASLYVHHNVLDASLVPCSVTRLLYPFFASLDVWMNEWSSKANNTGDSDVIPRLDAFLVGRDVLWKLVKCLPLDLGLTGPVAFKSDEFITQWRWLRKRLSSDVVLFDPSMTSLRQVLLLAESIDQTIFGGSFVQWSSHKIKKKMMLPLTPSKSIQWDAFVALNGLARQSALVDHHLLDPFSGYPRSLTIQALVDESHPCLYVTNEDRFELLGALSTLQLSWPRTPSQLNNAWINRVNFTKSMQSRFEKLKDQFDLGMARARVDHTIQTVANQLESSALESLAGHSENTSENLNEFCKLKKRIFGVIERTQLSTLAEFWCVWKETNICAQLCGVLLECQNSAAIQSTLVNLLPEVKSFVKIVVTMTTWSVGDLSPFQLLIWAAEQEQTESFDAKLLLRSLIPEMLSTLSSHSFSVSLVRGYSIMAEMEMPLVFGDEEAQTMANFDSRCVSGDAEIILGSTRLLQPVRSEFVLNSIGSQFSLSSRGRRPNFYTIENAKQRENQSKGAMDLLSAFRVSVSKSRLKTYHYVLYDILSSVKDVFCDTDMRTILLMVQYPQRLRELANIDDIDLAGKQVRNEFFEMYWQDIILPLLRSLYVAWRSDISSAIYKQHCATTSIFLGLLRLTVLTPESPVDPGRAPLAKASLIDRQLIDVKGKVIVAMLHSGFTEGNFFPVTPALNVVLDSAKVLTKKRKSQMKKVVERLDNAAPFFELFSEIKEFTSTVASVSSVLELMDVAQSAETATFARERIRNWQSTAGSFCRRLPLEMVGFDDILIPLLDSVRMIQDGFFHFSVSPSVESTIGDFLGSMLRFPMAIGSNSIDCLRSRIQSLSERLSQNHLQRNIDCVCNLSLALLARFCLKGSTKNLNDKEMKACSVLFANLLSSSGDAVSDQTKESSLEELQEAAFREQFPDHRRDFESLLQGSHEGEDLPFADENTVASEDVTNTKNFLTDALIGLLYRMYVGVFSDTFSTHADFVRKICFHCSYAAAYEVQKSFDFSPDAGAREPLSAHVFAISLSLLPTKSMTKMYPYLSSTGVVTDFHNEACPSVALAAALPLERLMARTTQLLTAFPGHSILLGLFKVCEKVNKLNIVTTPIGKVMTGMEVILRQAQDWEQHASEKVLLGTPLEEIGKLVSEWRRLELESWANLIDAREKRYVDRARKHWIRLHGLLSSTGGEPILESQHDGRLENADRLLIPEWVWKGLRGIRHGFTNSLIDVNVEDVRELVKALDTFMLTSPLGEFQERMNVLKACASDLFVRCSDHKHTSSWRLQQARATFSLWKYYTQYTPFLLQKIQGLRKPVEERLKSEIKLAKWDNQSYYALAESTERNQRKLMKILSEFDESMDLNVGILIQENSCQGLRSRVDHYDECCANFPAIASMFPFETRDVLNSENAVECRSAHFVCPISNQSVNADKIGLPAEARARNIAKYARKMAETSKSYQSSPSRARVGGDQASLLCQAVFERIDALQSKSTRPMKERAVVDLFRELKRNGFSATKWSTPAEVRQVEQIFLLPTPPLPLCETTCSTITTSVEKGEQYFLKCVSEMQCLSSEISLLGSKYMTKRETEIMVNIGYSSLMMLTQQRCLLAKAMDDVQKMRDAIKMAPSSKSRVPQMQAELCQSVAAFEETQGTALESIQQLRLLVSTTQASIENENEKNWARDVASSLDSLLKGTKLTDRNTLFVTHEMLQDVKTRCQELTHAQSVILEFHRECQSVSPRIPQDAFEVCLNDIHDALETGNQCKMHSEASLQALSKAEGPEDLSVYRNFCSKLAAVIDSTLVSYQNLSKHAITLETTETDDDHLDDDSPSIGDCHRDASSSATLVDLKKVSQDFVAVLGVLRELHSDSTASINGLESCTGMVTNTKCLLTHTLEMAQRALEDTAHFYSSLAKLNYVLVRVFRVLVSKGYCSDKTIEGDEEEGDVSGMTFGDDNDGTGMGEGDGKNDVTDQLENEDQLAGLKSDEKNDQSGESEEPKQLNEEEADQGMEMEADFDGDMFDMPNDPQDKEEAEDNEDEEELEREMGDEANADDQVVDEKMWDESDNEEDVDASQEKHEENSGVEGDPIDDAIRTKDGQDEQPDKSSPDKSDARNDNPEKDLENEEGEGDGHDQDEKEDVNDDLEDLYEENHGVDVRGEDNENGNEDPDHGEEQMELDNDLNLDDEEADDGTDGTNKDDDAVDDGESMNDDVEAEDGIAEQAEAAEEDAETNEKTTASAAEGDMEVEKGEEDPEQDDGPEEPLDISRQDHSDEAAHGIQSKDGADAVAENPDASEEEENRDDGKDPVGNPTGGQSQGDQTEAEGSNEGGYSNHTNEALDQSKSEVDSNDIPNPLKDPGDASKFWHRRLNIIDSGENGVENGSTSDMEGDEAQTPQEPTASNYEYSSGQGDSTQVLGDATEEEAIELEPTKEDQNDDDDSPTDNDTKETSNEKEKTSADRNDRQSTKRDTKKAPPDDKRNENDENHRYGSGDEDDDEHIIDADNAESASMSADEHEDEDEDIDSGTKVVSDLSRLNVDEAESMARPKSQIQQKEEMTRIGISEANDARSRWLVIQGETQGLARRLCEKVRLVLEPLVASKLRGDYRTGKRINMKRVIGYIASGYRKDKIWLRRTKPAKRDYRVLLAVDDSESMKKSGAGEMALRAMATVAVGMNQLEVGELGVASFGEDMKLVHPFHSPFTSESGAEAIRNFKFDQQRTRIALCVESAMAALEEAGGGSSMQLVFLISDGRIERDSRSALKRLIREMMERNILLAMIIVEGNEKKKDSILNMKEVTFEKGKPNVKRFIEDYPFPYYIVLDDVATLPEVLGDALKQWFEILTQLQSPGR